VSYAENIEVSARYSPSLKTTSPKGTLRALTLRQPWAWAILHAGKDIENRSWTNRYVTGTIAIHAGYGVDSLENLPRGAKKPRPEDLVRGAIVGVVDVVGVVRGRRSKWFIGPLGWLLRNPRPLIRPIPCKGRLGLWPIPRRVREEIARQLRVGGRVGRYFPSSTR
jgi:hypothetical protein